MVIVLCPHVQVVILKHVVLFRIENFEKGSRLLWDVVMDVAARR